MKKILLSVLSGVFILVSCSKEKPQYVVYSEPSAPAPAVYTEWDKKVKVNIEEPQELFIDTPRKIEKPLDMYMVMALALKYNYTRRLTGYEQALNEMGHATQTQIPDILNNAGYIGKDSKLKNTWNMLDMSVVYYQSQDHALKPNLVYEQSRKVIHNLLQEVRTQYWKTLTAQKLLPVMDEMIEFMVLEVDELNAKTKALADAGKNLSSEELVRKRKYMEAVQNLSNLKRDLETSQIRLASLMGFHPSAEYRLVGPEYGNFELPEIKSSLSQLETITLDGRPELRAYNYQKIKHAKGFSDPGRKNYEKNPDYYNQMWSKRAKQIGLGVFEDVGNPTGKDLEELRYQRITNLVLSQLYVSWANYMSAVEDYQISQEIAYTSEDIAEDVTIQKGIKNSKSHLEAARAIADEVKASMAYVNLQESLGDLYVTIGLDAFPYYMLQEKPSQMAMHLRNIMTKWKSGKFLPENRPYLMDIPANRPPLNLSSARLMPDVKYEVGQRINIKVPQKALDKADFRGKVRTKAGLVNDKPLPKWLRYNENTMEFSGTAMPSDIGDYDIKVYLMDDKGQLAFIIFKLTVVEVYVPSMKVMGMTEGRKATVLKRCIHKDCKDAYVEDGVVGNEVERMPE